MIRNNDKDSVEYRFVDDIALKDNDLDPGGIIVYSLLRDKYLFVKQPQRVPVETAMRGFLQGCDARSVEQELAAQGWDFDANRFLRLMYFRGFCTSNGQFFNGDRSADDYIEGNDETWAFSRMLLCWSPKRHWLSARCARRLIAGAEGVVLAAFVVVIAAFLIDPSVVSSFADAFLLARTIRIGRGLALALPTIAIVLGSLFLHELAHVIAARKHGLILRSVQLRLYRGIQTMILVQLPGIPVLPKRAQFEVALAGPVANLMVSLVLLSVYWIWSPSGTSGLVVLISSIGNLLMFLTNMNPFFPTDGYKFLSVQLFGNVDVKSAVVAKLRATGFPSLSRTEKAYFCAYLVSVAAIVYFAITLIIAITAPLQSAVGKVGLVLVRVGLSMAIASTTLRSTFRFLKGAGA